EDAEIAVGPRDFDLVDLFVDERPVRRHDLELQVLRERHDVYRFAAFATTSSIDPARKKSCSLIASCLPSTISLKPRIVSAIGTYLPSRAVNCWATKNGWDRNR